MDPTGALASEPPHRPTDVSPSPPTLVGIVAHELRAPLQSLLVCSEVLVDHLEELDPTDLRHHVQIIGRGTRQLALLVENLLYTARSSTGALTVTPRATRPLDLVVDLEPIIQPLFQQKSQIFRVSTQPDLPPVSADAPPIRQALVNLLVNASKFAAVGSTIDLRLRRRPAALRMVVADRGPGLPPGRVPQLFQPYGRGNPAVSAGAEGIGLGLYIVRTIIEAHTGRVGARNRRGGGAEFWFDLPWAPA